MQLSLASVLYESRRRHPDEVALVWGDTRTNYTQLWAEVLETAGALRESGVGPGDHVALLAPNTPDFVITYYAILVRGGVVVPVPPMLVPEEISYLVGDSGAVLIVSSPVFLENARKASAAAGVPAVATTDLTALAATSTPETMFVTRSALDPAVLFYTSGTTGRPKGAVLSHGNLVLNALTSALFANEFRSDDVSLACLPLFHIFGQTVALNSLLLVGGRVVLQAQFNADEALDLMINEGVTVLVAVPTMYVALLEVADGRDTLPSPRLCISGGAALPVAVLEAFDARFGVRILEGYGLSETSPLATVNQERFGRIPGSVGHAVWGVDVEIARAEVDDRVELLATGELGEIVVRGHNVFTGYHDNPEATAAAVVDGWFRTGDLGRRDDSGAVHIVDRKKDMIIRGGYNIYPREVEEILVRHPAVGQVAVIGLPDAVRGEEVLAVVVPTDPADPPDAQEIIDWSRERIARHKYPRRVEFVTELPLGPSRKVLKRELRRRFTETGFTETGAS